MVDEKRLKAIQERADKADPGPWSCFLGSGMNVCTAVGYDREDGGVTIICDCLTDYMLDNGHAAADHLPNMMFIEHAREDIPYLLEALKGEMARNKVFGDCIKRALDIYLKAHPECDYWIDGADNIVWLLDQNDQLRAKVKELEEKVSELECDLAQIERMTGHTGI